MIFKYDIERIYSGLWVDFCKYSQYITHNRINSFPPKLKINNEDPKNTKYFKCASTNFSVMIYEVDNKMTIAPLDIEIEIYPNAIIKYIKKQFNDYLTSDQLELLIEHTIIHEFFHYYEHLEYFENYCIGNCDDFTYYDFLSSLKSNDELNSKNNSKHYRKKVEESEFKTETRCLQYLYAIFDHYFNNTEYLIQNGVPIQTIESIVNILNYLRNDFEIIFGEDCELDKKYEKAQEDAIQKIIKSNQEHLQYNIIFRDQIFAN